MLGSLHRLDRLDSLDRLDRLGSFGRLLDSVVQRRALLEILGSIPCERSRPPKGLRQDCSAHLWAGSDL